MITGTYDTTSHNVENVRFLISDTYLIFGRVRRKSGSVIDYHRRLGLETTLPKYRASGLILESEIVLPGLIDSDAPDKLVDIRAYKALVPLSFDSDGAEKGPSWELLGSRFLLRVPNVARFLLTGGKEIAFEVEPNGNEADVAIFLIGTVLGILLHQRGQIVFHGSAVRVGEKAVLFLGPSGAGKSTMAAALGPLGYPLISDDLCSTTIQEDGQPVVQPDGRLLKLWSHALDRLEMNEARADPVRHRLEKFYVEPKQYFAAPAPVAAIYALREARPPDSPGIIPLALADTAICLRRNAYRPFLVRRMGQKAIYFHGIAAICDKAKVFDLVRPLDFEKMPEVIQWLEASWRDLGLLEAE